MLMDDASWLAQLMLQYMSKSPTASMIDREIGDLKDDLFAGKAALTYLRYNVDLEVDSLRALGLEDLADKAADLREMSKAENRQDLNRIGTVAGENLVKAEHLPANFDVAPINS
jgi:hypothetical protein